MKILFLSFFYEPDLSAGSFRAKAILTQLDKVLPEYVEIHVITTQPNRYSSFVEKAEEEERSGRCVIHRVPVNTSKPGFLGQILRFIAYFKFVYTYSKKNKFSSVFATSGRMFTASTAVFIAKKQGISSYVDIRDIFVDTLDSVFKNPLFIPLKAIFKLIEKYTFTNATRVNLISPGFLAYFNHKYPQLDNIDFFTNGIDEKNTDINLSEALPSKLNDLFLKKQKKYIFYAGNIGESQGLELLLPAFAKLVDKDFDIIIVGDGNARLKLVHDLEVLQVTNVHIFPPVKRDAVLEAYKHVDVLLTNLAAVPAFEKVIPSKLFEYGATGLPIIAGLQGFPKKFVNENIANCEVFEPSNAKDAFEKLNRLHFGKISRDKFITEYSRGKIVEVMVDSIIKGIPLE